MIERKQPQDCCVIMARGSGELFRCEEWSDALQEHYLYVEGCYKDDVYLLPIFWTLPLYQAARPIPARHELWKDA